jgi:tRNA threonylcarbamoyladenosine biosynthesis protein TsaE
LKFGGWRCDENYICIMEISFKLEQIQQIAAQILSILDKPGCIILQGEMGAGKTTMTQALCRALGVKDKTGSPTFSIINEYATKTGKTIYHLDLYRLKSEAEAVTAGVEDCLYSGSYCFVEWPERAPGLFESGWPVIEIRNVDEDTRTLKIKSYI